MSFNKGSSMVVYNDQDVTLHVRMYVDLL